MHVERWGLVEIVRDFLTSHQIMTRLSENYRQGRLRFGEVQEFVGDAEDSVLFRLKERCHALFRHAYGGTNPVVWPEVLLDLAVGSLFHEAMKLRENLYQQEVYAPKVRSLRDDAHEEVDEFLLELERSLAVSSTRLYEALLETEALFEQTRRQLTVLLRECRDGGLVTRCLLEREAQVDEVFPQGLDALVSEIHGDVATAYRAAAESYIQSAHFAEAFGVLRKARARIGDRSDLVRLSLYAEGMQAFLEGSYAQSLEQLGAWLDAGLDEREVSYAGPARATVLRVAKLVGTLEGGEGPLSTASEVLAERLAALIPGEDCPSSGVRR